MRKLFGKVRFYDSDPPQEPTMDDPPKFEGPEKISQPEHTIRHEDKALCNVPFPLLSTWADYTYKPCTIPYRFPSDPPHQPTHTELLWIELFRKSIPSLKKQAEADDTVPDASSRAAKFAQRYSDILDELQANPENHGGPPDCILLCRLRELCLIECGFRDIFRRVKDEENKKALSLLDDVIKLADGIEDRGERIEHLLKGVFAGNIFDLGVNQLAELFAGNGMSFLGSYEKLLPRPWVIDDLEQFKLRWLRLVACGRYPSGLPLLQVRARHGRLVEDH
ncbi:hypothetical protein L7F22_067676 [Adiantum nelumboides]|nr:hypothetical protein [Adiantum nelumboides]